MFNFLGRSVSRHPIRVIVAWLILVVLACAGTFYGFGQGDLFSRLYNPVSLLPGSESDEVNSLASSNTEGTSMTVVINGLDMEADGAAIAMFMAAHRQTIADLTGVATAFDPFQLPDLSMPQAQAMFSDKKDGFIISIVLDKDLDSDDEIAAEADVRQGITDFEETMRKDFPDAATFVLSTQGLSQSIMDQAKDDLVRGEAVGLPVALLLLIIVFGGFVAAGLPIAGALVAIGIGMGSLWAMTFATDVETFTLNIASIIGLALSVDYGLLIVSRYREELTRALNHGGYTTDGKHTPTKEAAKPIVRAAMEETLRTAGRTVFFSAVTIACAMAALLIMEAPMLRIIAASAMIVTLLAVLTAMTLVPAIIVLLRRVLIRPSVITRIPILRSMVRAVGDSSSDRGFFSRLAHGVHKRPWLIMAVVALILVAMASPLRDLQMRTTFSDFFTEGRPEVQAYFIIQADYPALVQPSLIIVADKQPEDTMKLVAHLQDLDDVSFVSPPAALASDDHRSVITVRIDVENQVGQEMTQMVKDLRAYDAGYPILVGGPAAIQLDFLNSIYDRAGGALAIMGGAVFLLMFLMTGSLIIPLKAIIVNSLSLLASLGVATLIFMNGWIGMPKVMGMETFILVCAVCFGFGLAMDYEVFLIARIKEFWDSGVSNDQAVERGLQRSGRIITSAAAIIVAVFIGFTFGEMLAIKEIGVVLAITVITDATLVRMLLVPATMTILGKWNWWAPKPLKWVYSRLKIVH